MTGPRAAAQRRQGPVTVLGWSGTDAELLERLRRDPEAGAALFYDRFATDVNRLVWRLLGADQDHDDIVQLVFYKLITKVSSVQEAERLGGWVQSATVNTVYSELRKRAVRRAFLRREASAPLRYEDGTRRVEHRDLLAIVYAEMDKMPVGERIAFTLRHMEEKPLAEVAALCNCSLATIKRRLVKASKRFEAACAKYPELRAKFASLQDEGQRGS